MVAYVTGSVAQTLTMSIPFSHYLQSNQAPSEYETREIKALRANPLKEISIIDVEIERIEGILNSVKRKRAHIQESIDDFNTILAPVRRLSADVLGVIFNHCLATHRNPVMSASEAPILLTQICRYWRAIALSIPRLWSRLYIPTMREVRYRHHLLETLLETLPLTHILEGERRMEARTEEVQRWLRLSAACPLAVTLMAARDPISHPPLLDSIIQSSRRWQQLELGCFLSSESDVLTRLLSISPDDLCMLRELRIHSLYTTDSIHSQEVQDDLWYQSGLLNAPGLRSIFIADIPQITPLNAGIPPNWKNLNHLFIYSPIILGLAHQILTSCCNLVACLLEIAGYNDFGTIPNASITLPSCIQILPHLTFLSLQGESAGCNKLLGSIKAPSLQILEYLGYFPIEFDELSLFNFLQNIDCLKTLRVDHYLITKLESSVLKNYILIPSVTHLVLGRLPKRNYRHVASEPHLAFYLKHAEHLTLITALHQSRHQYSPDSAPTVLFPSLEIFEAYNISGVNDIIFLEFIKARIDATKSNAGVSKLKKVLVEFSRTRQTDIIPEALAYAQAAGINLELDLKYYPTEKELDVTWSSPSSGLSTNDVSWVYPLYDY